MDKFTIVDLRFIETDEEAAVERLREMSLCVSGTSLRNGELFPADAAQYAVDHLG